MTDTLAEHDTGTGVLEYVPPGSLTLALNVRVTDVFDPDNREADAAFLASIRDRGVRTPISAYRDPTGTLMVSAGQRRTLAAVRAGRDVVPVLVEAAPSDDADRITDQVLENQARAALAPADLATAYNQLALLGVSAEDIARTTGSQITEVRSGLRAAQSRAAAAALATHRQATLEQAEVLAELEDAPGAVERLTEVLDEEPEDFWHAAERERRDWSERQSQEALRAELAEQNVRVVEDTSYRGDPRRTYRMLDELLLPGGESRQTMTVEAHASCPGHAAIVGRNYDHRQGGYVYRAEFVCADPRANGHALLRADATLPGKPEKGSPEAEAESEKRRTVIQRNRDMAAAEVVRRRWLTELLARSQAPSGAATFIARHLGWQDHWLTKGFQSRNMLGELLGLKGDVGGGYQRLVASAAGQRATVLTLALIVAAYEEKLEKSDWRIGDQPTQERARRDYFAALDDWGYPLADVERLILRDAPRRRASSDASGGPKKTAAKKTAPKKTAPMKTAPKKTATTQVTPSESTEAGGRDEASEDSPRVVTLHEAAPDGEDDDDTSAA